MPWRAALLKGTRVLARCDPAGAFLADGGRVEVRYRASDSRAYMASARNLEPVGTEILPDEHVVAGERVAKDKPAASKGSRGASAAASSGGTQQVEPGQARFVAYTDGACSGNPGPAGLGVVLMHDGGRRELSEYLGTATNNIAELTAILRALEAVATPDDSVVVHTDSQYAIGVLQKGWKAKANQELIADIKAEMKRFTALRFVYVPGHAGVPLNERADVLARQAVSTRGTSGWTEVRGSNERAPA